MKPLGQHFLKNKSALKKIAGALDIKAGDTIVEIGAGHGELTEQLISQSLNLKTNGEKIKIIAIEKDKKLAESLPEKFLENKNIEIIEGDALKILTNFSKFQIPNSKFKLVGNIPYYITGRLLRILSEMENKPSLCVFTIQKEVAERIVAAPPRMNRLAAITQFWAEPKILFLIPREDFSPQPKVDSAVIKLESSGSRTSPGKSDFLRYAEIVRALFAQPRQTILNNLTRGLKIGRGEIAGKLSATNINPGDRPQNLGVEEIIQISLLNSSSVKPRHK